MIALRLFCKQLCLCDNLNSFKAKCYADLLEDAVCDSAVSGKFKVVEFIMFDFYTVCFDIR